MANNNVISFQKTADEARNRLIGERFRRAVRSMQGYLQKTLPQLVQDLFDHLDDEFYAMADKSASDLLQTRYFDAMRELRKHRSSIEQQFVQGRLTAFEEFWEAVPPRTEEPGERASRLTEDELSLVEEDVLEEELAISSVVSKAENRYHRTLFALNKRFAAIHRVEEFDVASNPVGPRALVEAFSEALSVWQSETDVRLIVYKLFDRYVMAYVGGVYDELNDILVDNDILPRISQRVRRNPVAPSVRQARAEQGGEAGDAGFDPEMLNMIGRMLSERWRAEERMPWYARADSTPQLPQIPTSELLGALDEVQRHTLNMAPPDLASLRELQDELMQTLGRELKVGSPERPMKRLGEGDRSMLDVMELLFDFILGDENLPEPMKALLGRLQIPLLKVGLRDRRFFSDARHPARRLLNNLARAGLAWIDDGDRSVDSPYGRIESAVMRILSDFDDDIAVFEKVNEEFEGWLEREQRHAQIAEQRLTQTREGQEQLHLARTRVAEEIQRLIEGGASSDCRVPEVVERLLKEAWHDVMLLALLREGGDSEQWQQALALAERLVWSVQPKHEPSERQRLLKAIPEILSGLREGLNNISFDPHKAGRLFKALQACHIAALRGNRIDGEEDGKPAAPPEAAKATERHEQGGEPVASEPAPQETMAEEVPSSPPDEFLQMAQALVPGVWLEWTDESGRELRGKLSWRSQLTGNCVFVDRRGMKLAELGCEELATMLREGRARQLEDPDTPLMDRALNAMLKVLNRTDPVSHTH